VYTRRAGQGALAEDEPLAVRGAWKKPFTARADVILAIGFKFWSGEHFGQPPAWSADATYIQVDAAPSRVGWHVPAEIPIVGDPKLVLQQLTERAAQLAIDGAARRGAPGSRRSPARASSSSAHSASRRRRCTPPYPSIRRA
jgi:thiamine pyrophosphate-dependent acetolactate synthase large subunit-like protein